MTRESTKATLVAGDRVTVGVANVQETGTVKFCGPTQFSAGEWVGVELDVPHGKNDGSVKGVSYFVCKELHGIFVRKANLEKVVKGGGSSSSRAEPKEAPRTVQPRASILAQKELAQATEDRDVGRISRTIRAAHQVGGVDTQEIQQAQDILHFETQKRMIKEFDKVRTAVSKLAVTVKAAEERAAQVEKAAGLSKEVLESSSAQASIKAWLSQCVERIESDVWSSIERQVEDKVRTAIARALGNHSPNKKPQESRQEIAAKKLQGAVRRYNARLKSTDFKVSRMAAAAILLRRRYAAWSAIFDTHAGSSGLQKESFSNALREIHPRLSPAQGSAIFEGFTSGTGAVDVDLIGFCNISEAAAIGDHDLAEFGDISVEDFQALADASGANYLAADKSDATALKAQARERDQRTAQDPETTAAARIQARARGSITRKQAENQKSAIVKIQRAIRTARAQHAGTNGQERCISNLAKVLRRRHNAWADMFDEAIGDTKQEGLSADPFTKALLKIHPRLSTAQCSALYDGYVAGTDQPLVNLNGFCSIAEAVAVNDSYAAEFADISLQKFLDLGKGPVEAEAESYCKSLVRKSLMHANQRATRDSTAYLESLGERAVRKSIVSEAKRQSVSEQAAIQRQSVSYVSSLEARALKHAGEREEKRKTLQTIEEPEEEEANEEKKEKKEKKDKKEKKEKKDKVEGSEKKDKKDKKDKKEKKDDGASSSSSSSDEAESSSKGNTDKKEENGLTPAGEDGKTPDKMAELKAKARRSLSAGLKKGTLDASVTTNMQGKQTKSALFIQRFVRGNQARGKVQGLDFGKAALVARRRFKAWASIFDEVCAKSGLDGNLNETAFSTALRQIYPSVAEKQVAALWTGFLEGTDKSTMDMAGFVNIAEAVASGPQVAAEFADMSVGDYEALGEATPAAEATPAVSATSAAEATPAVEEAPPIAEPPPEVEEPPPAVEEPPPAVEEPPPEVEEAPVSTGWFS